MNHISQFLAEGDVCGEGWLESWPNLCPALGLKEGGLDESGGRNFFEVRETGGKSFCWRFTT